MMAKRKYYYYEWGNEKPGYVSVWHVGESGAVVHDRRITKDEAYRRGYVFWCPWA